MNRTWALLFGIAVASAAPSAPSALAQTVTIDTSSLLQTIDGFGTCLAGGEGQEQWFQQLYYDDLRSSILRIDLTPPFVAPYSDRHYNSPWFGQDPAIDGGGPEGNYVRTYTGPADYTRSFAGRQAQIAVMGPDIDDNVRLLNFDAVRTPGVMAQVGESKKAALGDFKLYGSMWSPAPWLKISSGNRYPGGNYPLPAANTPWPFIWGGNFAGGLLDTSNTPRAEFDDSAAGGTGPTSALTQFARGLAAYLRGFQNTYNVRFYAISIQNEVNFEEFYNSCSYPLSSQYIAALTAARAELDRYPDLAPIQIVGPEDLLGGDGYGLWQYGGGNDVTHKNLQYLRSIGADPVAERALAFFSIHGYDSDGASSAGGNPRLWDWWANGWTASPAAGLPATVAGFTSFGKKSWMTETSGEQTTWLAPATGFPGNGGWSIALKIHQALTTGRESAWIYWQLSDGDNVAAQTLTDATTRERSPKYVGAKHFFRHIRPGARAATTTVQGSSSLVASAYWHQASGALTAVLINTSASPNSATIVAPPEPSGLAMFDVFTSSDGSYWVQSAAAISGGRASIDVPGFGVVTIVGNGGSVAVDGGVPSDASSQPGDAAAGGDAAAAPTDAIPGAPDAVSGAPDAAAAGDSGGATTADGGAAGPGDGPMRDGKIEASCGCSTGRAARSSAPAPLLILLTAAAMALRRTRR